MQSAKYEKGAASIDAGSRNGSSMSQTQHHQNFRNDIFRNRTKSVLPPIENLKKGGGFGSGKKSIDFGARTPGKLVKLTEDDFNSETRSVYKLDPSENMMDRFVPRKSGNKNIDSIIQTMNMDDRA